MGAVVVDDDDDDDEDAGRTKTPAETKSRKTSKDGVEAFPSFFPPPPTRQRKQTKSNARDRVSTKKKCVRVYAHAHHSITAAATRNVRSTLWLRAHFSFCHLRRTRFRCTSFVFVTRFVPFPSAEFDFPLFRTSFILVARNSHTRILFVFHTHTHVSSQLLTVRRVSLLFRTAFIQRMLHLRHSLLYVPLRTPSSLRSASRSTTASSLVRDTND